MRQARSTEGGPACRASAELPACGTHEAWKAPNRLSPPKADTLMLEGANQPWRGQVRGRNVGNVQRRAAPAALALRRLLHKRPRGLGTAVRLLGAVACAGGCAAPSPSAHQERGNEDHGVMRGLEHSLAALRRGAHNHGGASAADARRGARQRGARGQRYGASGQQRRRQ